MAEKNWKSLIDDVEKENEELYKRMDEDRKLLEDAFELLDADGEDLPHSISVTVNDPLVFAANVEAALGSSAEQVQVESEDINLDTAIIEDIIKRVFHQADESLVSNDEFPLNPVIDQMMTRRGSGAARCLVTNDNGELKVSIVPWDTRFVRTVILPDGTKAYGYKTFRRKEDIEAEYPRGKKSEGKYDYPPIKDKSNGTVLDVWTPTENVVYIQNEIVIDEKHKHGDTVIFQMVPIGTMLADIESRKKRGESIFFLIRDLIPELNRLISIASSLTLKQLDAAMTWTDEMGGEPPDYDDATKPGSITTARSANALQQVPYGDIKRSALLLHQMIETRIQRGSLSSIDLGTLNFPMSAVALVEIGEGRDQVFLPRLGSRGLMKQRLAAMAIAQILNLGVSTFKLGTRGHKREFKKSDLEGQYDITYQYFIKTPQIDIARVSLAASMGSLVPDSYKRREILKLPDPDAAERDLNWELAARLSPAIQLQRIVVDLLARAEKGDRQAEIEARLLSAEMGATLQQMLSGSGGMLPTVEKANKPQQPTGMVPLMGQGGGRQASAIRSAQMQAQPPEGEGEANAE